MNNEIRNENLNTESDEISLNGRGDRQRLAASVRKIGELIKCAEEQSDSRGADEAEEIIIAGIPNLKLVTGNGPLKNIKEKRNVKESDLQARIVSISSEQVDQIQGGIEMLMATALVVDSLSSAKRLGAYLPFSLPDTQEGFRMLKQVARGFNESLSIPAEGSIGDIPGVLRVLKGIDDQLKIIGLNDPEVVNALSGYAREQAELRLEKSKITSSDQVAQIRADIAQQRIYALKREAVDISGTRGYSRYEVLANQIIERDNLYSQIEVAREEVESRRTKEREAVLNTLARRRAIGVVISLIDQDPLVCQALAQRSRISPEELSSADLGRKMQIAVNAINAKQIVLSSKDRKVLYGGLMVTKERARLTQTLEDPLSFIARLSDDELAVIRRGISKVSDENSVYKLAGEKLKKEIEAEITDSEVIVALTKLVLGEMLESKAPLAIDSVITQMGLDKASILKDPSVLDPLKDEIVARGLEAVISISQQEVNEKRALVLSDSERRVQKANFLAIYRPFDLKTKASAIESRLLLDQCIEVKDMANLGLISLREDIKSTLGPFQIYSEYKTVYPPVVLRALESLYAEYNQAFRRLLAANREYDTDYQYCLAPDGMPINSFVQIDMVGLPARFLKVAENLDEESVKEALRGRIFEIENSLAMYSLLEYFFSDGTTETLFRRQFLTGLDNIKRRYGRPIALLAVTDQKYQAMKATEFGKVGDEPLTDEEVKEYSGFDRLFSPEGFKEYLTRNNGQSEYLLYVRSSDPVAKMRRPELLVDETLLGDDELRRVIKANSLTFNIDNPSWAIGDSRRINDTKEYLCTMGMAFPVYYMEDLVSAEFKLYLSAQGIDLSQTPLKDIEVRAKPMKGTYGGYGHIHGGLEYAKFKRNLRNALLKRGVYIVQPELKNPIIVDERSGRPYMYIDRVFFSSDGSSYQFMGGERTLMPIGSNEAENNRVHGNISSVYAEII